MNRKTSDNRNAWEIANYHFNKIKGNYANSIKLGYKVLPEDFVNKLNLNCSSHGLHLFCNDGRESAYLSFKFGCQFDGVDFSSEAIKFARKLWQDLGTKGVYYHEDVYTWLQQNIQFRYDIIIITLGSIRWAEDLRLLFTLIKDSLTPTGRLVLWDFHPFIHSLNGDGQIEHNYVFMSNSLIRNTGVKPYMLFEHSFNLVNRRKVFELDNYNNQSNTQLTRHSLSSVLSSVYNAGLILTDFTELNYIWEEQYLPCLVEKTYNKFSLPHDIPDLPLSFIIECKNSTVC